MQGDFDRRSPPRLLCLDLQRGPGSQTGGHSGGVTGRDSRVARCQDLMAFARTAGWPVLHSFRLVGPIQPLSVEGLEPMASETVLLRRGASAFSHPRMAELASGSAASGLVILALTLGAPCITTALQAHELGVEVQLVTDTLCPVDIRGVGSMTVREVLLGIASPFTGLTSTAELLGDRPVKAAND